MNITYNEECVEGMKRLEDNFIDLTVTSPPYDNIRTYNGFVFDWHNVIKELYRITKEGGVVVWIVSDQTVNGSESGTSFRQALYAMECGFNLHDTMIWYKDSCAFPGGVRYPSLFEYMFIWSKGKPKTFNPIQDRKNKYAGTKVHGTYRMQDGTIKRRTPKSEDVYNDIGIRFNVWEIPTEKNNKTGHPAVFPLQLVADHIRSWSNEGDIILDPFLGSGTTRIAATELNRQFIGFEISKEYFDKEEERFRDYSAQLSFLH